MALNSITYASKYAAELDKMIVQKAVTGFFADNIMKAQFVGAHTVLIPDIDFVGLGDYDRDNGFPQGKTAITNTSYTLAKDRRFYRSMYVQKSFRSWTHTTFPNLRVWR